MDFLKELLKEGGLRKVGIAVVMVGTSTYLVAVGKLPPENYMTLMQWIVGGFFGANTIEHFLGKAEADKK